MLLKRKRQKIKRGIAWALVCAMVFQIAPLSVRADAETARQEEVQETSEWESGKETSESVQEDSQESVQESQQENVQESPQENVQEDSQESLSEDKDVSDVFADGRIKIYSLAQLYAIGTGAAVTTTDHEEGGFGSGETVWFQGEQVTYGLDADYVLMNDIQLDSEDIWTLPEDFAGSFTGGPTEESRLYDSQTDTVYVYHDYQLLTIAEEAGANEPVMSKDMIPEKFGMGQMLTQSGEDYLTYSREHTYVLSAEFTEQRPTLQAEAAASGQEWLEDEERSGRARPGQLYTEIEGERYILIGNESQLRAIGSDKQVTPRLYVYHSSGVVGGLLGGNPSYTPYYPGDADLGLSAVASKGGTTHIEMDGLIPSKVNDKVSQNFYSYYYKKKNEEKPEAEKYKLADIDLTDDSILEGVLDLVGGILGGLTGKDYICGVDENGLPNNEEASLSTLQAEYKDLKYSSDANYIIFRNIDLRKDGENSNKQDDNWEPIHFSGKMEGRLNLEPGTVPVIQNITVEKTGKLDLEKDSGIGFFGTISNRTSTADFQSAGKAVVRDLKLDNVTVDNQSSEIDKEPDSLIEGLTGLLGGLLGGILGGITSNLPIVGNLKLGEVIKDLLTLKKNSPDLFATGSFAGRITGDVQIENCTVTNAEVRSVKGISGGFAGYIEGEAQYDLLSGTLGGVVNLLSTLLNIVPGVGLGDLVTILLQNDVPLGNLIPIGYYNPELKGCSVAFSDSGDGNCIGDGGQDYNGGFVGIQTAARISDSSVKNLGKVQAKNGAGGFAGIARDAVIKGLLDDVGVKLYTLDIRSSQVNCTVEGTAVEIEAQEAYAGGMNGLMTNSVSQGCSVAQIAGVKAQKYVGGFTGRATIGYGTSVGSEAEKKNTLLNSVSGLLSKILTNGDEGELNALLSLSGASPSEIHGCRVEGAAWSVEASGDYAGGLVGRGDGVKINPGDAGFGAEVTGISSVTAENYAGGMAGSLTTADAIGILNDAVGVGRYLPFEIQDVKVVGEQMAVTAKKKYAAGFASLMLGGTAKQAEVTGLSSVTAANYAGGFAGRTGASGLADTGGLNVLGLVKLNNVLSLADGIRVTIEDSAVQGTEEGFSVAAEGNVEVTEKESVTAGGFIAEAVANTVRSSYVKNINEVSAQGEDKKKSCAGGFVGDSHTGGLAGLAQKEEDESLSLPGILDVNSLLNLAPYLIPEYEQVSVTFLAAANAGNPQVKAQAAGGFAGAMQSGIVDNTTASEAVAVYGLERVEGGDCAGGFAGKVDAGAAAASDGLSLLDGILSLDVTQLLQVLNVYIPQIRSAGVKSGGVGLTVEAVEKDSAAGGFIGYGSGVQISGSDVTSLKHTRVKPPSDSLEAADGSSYFDQEQSEYAVKAGSYAGGYIGSVDIDSAAAAGGGLKLLDGIEIGNVLEVLDTVASTIEDSNVSGCVGGFSVLADGKDEKDRIIGKAGGFAGEMSGAQIRRSDAENFAYIVGQEAAGGYVGVMEPGNVASVLDDSKILDGLLNVNDSLASLVNTFIPIIEDSHTSSVPCGGAVRAQGMTDQEGARGMAGGYAGYNHGGRIAGNQEECAVIRLRSVYGGEFAGGFTGLMENADLTQTGNLKLLYGLLEVSNVLSLLGAVYPTETSTAVYGPLRQVDLETWNAWAEAVGSNGVYGYQFPSEAVGSQEELEALISQYAYGYQVKAGRTSAGSLEKQAGSAGGYVGRMQGGVVTQAHAMDAKNVTAYLSAGGFAGEMLTGGAAEVGGVSLLKLPITGSVSAVQTFVPVIRSSGVTGFQSGMQIKATGIPEEAGSLKIEKTGYAGGFAGHMVGGQIWGSQSETEEEPDSGRCFVANLRKVEGTNSVGGFAGQIDPGSAAALDTAGSSGLVGGLLQNLIKAPNDLLKLLNSTLSTVQGADVYAWDAWGIIINGTYTDGTAYTRYARSAGGFAGEINGAVIGKADDPQSGVCVQDIRSVTGGEYAGGFVGLADVSAVAEIGEGKTSILGELLTLGSVDVLDAFRTYIYDSSVAGTKDAGLEVRARDMKKTEYDNNPVYTGAAGGFGGALLNGSVTGGQVTNLRMAEGQGYTGGFIGHLGKSGVADLDNLGLLDNVLGLGAGVMDLFGSHVENSKVVGMEEGFTVMSKSTVSQEEGAEIAGGFTGFADLAKLDGNTVENLKQVASKEIAGGFAGRTSFQYLADLKGDSPLVRVLLDYLNKILQALWLKDLQEGEGIQIQLAPLVTVEAIRKGDLIHLNLLGLNIRIGLAEEDQLATVYIGDSKIELNCKADGSIQDEDALKDEIAVSLIKANRTKIEGCTVTGILDGYDVYGGGAGNQENGSGKRGYAGGFVGMNDEGLLKKNQMYLADVVRGTAGITGPFTGASFLDSSWDFNTIRGIEGEDNFYRIYRDPDQAYDKILGTGRGELQHSFESGQDWNLYTIKHMDKGKVEQFVHLKDAVMSGSGQSPKELLAYREDGAMAVLMDNTPTSATEPGDTDPPPDVQDPCTDTVELNLKKVWKQDREEERPEKIVLHITRTYEEDGETRTDESFQKEVILTGADAASKDIWEKVLSGPEYKAYHVGADESKSYYTYHVTEDTLDGYTTTITYTGKHQYGMTVTNKKNWFDSLLPDTGSIGSYLFYLIGALLLAVFGVTGLRKRRGKRTELL